MIMIASKIDVANKDKLAKLKRYAKKHDLEFYPISAVTGKGIDELKWTIAKKVEEIRTEQNANPSTAEDAESAEKTQEKA
jgi:GTP-binding protein